MSAAQLRGEWVKRLGRPLRAWILRCVAWGRRLTDAARLGLLPLAAVARLGRLRERRSGLDRALAGRAGESPLAAGSVTLIAAPGLVSPDAAFEVRAVSSSPGDLVSAWRRAAAGATGEVLVFVAPTSSAAAPDWLWQLVVAARADSRADHAVVAVAPQLLHPSRPWWRRTPADLSVRERGAVIAVEPDGACVLRARGAGESLDVGAKPEAVDVASSACVLVDRAAYEAVGGFADIADPDAAVVDLCLRLRAARPDSTIVMAPGSVLFDDRPLAAAADLAGVVGSLGRDGPAWREVVERHGARLWRMAEQGTLAATGGGPPAPVRIAITVAAPNRKVAARWGDTHLAEDLARSLARAGHDAWVVVHDERDDLAVRCADVNLVVRGLAPVRPSAGQRQVLWVMSHPHDLTAAECDAADLVLVASERFAATLAARTSTPVGVLLQATDPDRFRPEAAPDDPTHPAVVVAKTRDVLRPIVAMALEAGLRPVIYGSGWEQFGLGNLVASPYVSNTELPAVYAAAGVVLNDHWVDMAAEGFVSNRVFDVLACGTPLVSDPLPELDRLFGDAVWQADTAAELGRCVSEIRAGGPEVTRRVAHGMALVRDRHSFDRRAAQLVAQLVSAGLGEPLS